MTKFSFCYKIEVILFYLSYSLCSLNAEKPVDQPLFLTPYIEQGDIDNARRAAKVEALTCNVDSTVSYSGFLTVNKTYNSNMFFWFFPAVNHSKDLPVFLWLQGGPGRSSIYGLFEQIGPYQIDKSEKLLRRKYNWGKLLNILYIDNPVGTGFSFTEEDAGYSRTECDIGENLFIAIKQFFKLFPEYKKNDFYIGGSSYAGKFVPALAYTIDVKQENQIDKDQINLKGLIIGNGYFDPITIIQRSEILYQIGLINLKFKLELETYINMIISLINQKKFEEALDFDEKVVRKAVMEATGYRTTFNFLNDTFLGPFGSIDNYINNKTIRRKLHVGQLPFKTDSKVDLYLRNDIMQSVKPWVEYLLERYRILMHHGQMDLIVPYSSIMKFIQSMEWSGAEGFKNAKRKVWYVNNNLAGYVTSFDKLTEVLVRNAGHSAPIDKPEYIFNLVKEFIMDQSSEVALLVGTVE